MKQKILIVGLGNMGSSLAKGLLQKNVGEVYAFDTNIEKYQDVNVKPLRSEKEVAKIAYDAIFLCIKPQDLADSVKVLKPSLGKSTCVVSLLAAKTIEQVGTTLKFNGGIFRAMPNIAATIGEAATVVCKNDKVSVRHERLIEDVFASIGTVSWAKESIMDAVTGLSGSGPAYVYLIIEGLADGAVKMGMPRALALQLATQTVLGSAKLVKESGMHPAILRDQVVTPGGTTIAALHELEAHGIRAMLMDAVSAATEKAKEIRLM